MELTKLKKEYGKMEKRYKLPGFKILNSDFEIDKMEKESDSLLRAMRKMMMEKIVNSMGFLEMLLNPVNSPRMYINYIRAMSVDDKKRIDKIYGVLADLSVLSLDLEIDSNERGEASLILEVYNKWNEIKPDFKAILKNMKNPVKNNEGKKERGYFG
jgi:hypothetical protein